LKAIESLHMTAMPQILLRFFDEAESDSASVDTLAQLVLQDPALCARILTAANSANSRRTGELRSIKQSLMALGPRMVRTIASSLLVESAYQGIPACDARDLAGFWRHSLLVAELARGTAIVLGSNDGEAEEAYLAGLLHDVGKLLLLGGLGETYSAILARREGEWDLSSMERAILATDHGTVGAWLVDQWELPSLMADAILFHHLDADKAAGLDRLGRILWSAHAACLPPHSDRLSALQAVERLIGIDPTRFGMLRDEASARVDALASASKITHAPAVQTGPFGTGLRLSDDGREKAGNESEEALRTAMFQMTALQALPRDLVTLNSEIDLLLCVRESARILFGVQRMAFFLVQPGRQILSATGIGGASGGLQRLEIPLQPGSSLCAQSALGRESLTTFDLPDAQPLAPADRQIERALNNEGVLYVPLLAHGALLGVMALGVSVVQRKRLSARATWMRSYAGIVAGNLSTWRRMREREEQVEAEVAGRFVLQGQRVAHEVNNPLAIIRNYLTLLSNDAADGESSAPRQADISVLREEIERLSGMVKRLALDASSAIAPPGMIELNRVIEGMRTLYEASLFGAAGVRLDVDLPREPAYACVDRDTVKQIVFNLWKNAAEALRPGDVVVTALTAHVNQNGARFARITIHDSGPGLPAPVLDALYRPLSLDPRAPRREGGAGLGLSIVLALVEQVRGTITCHSRAEEGTTFSILIPESQGPAR
jgi:HD-like signal output (HDOD) protein/signal transduction histidine kinase